MVVMPRHSTPQALKLKEELEKRGVVVVSEKWDGHKHIDLVIHRSRLNIEVDGKQHYQDANQILADVKRSHYSDFKGYDTFHVPNMFIDSVNDLKKVADALAEAAKIQARRLGNRHHYHSYAAAH
jgi:very-short-patch-repair endonuclease